MNKNIVKDSLVNLREIISNIEKVESISEIKKLFRKIKISVNSPMDKEKQFEKILNEFSLKDTELKNFTNKYLDLFESYCKIIGEAKLSGITPSKKTSTTSILLTIIEQNYPYYVKNG